MVSGMVVRILAPGLGLASLAAADSHLDRMADEVTAATRPVLNAILALDEKGKATTENMRTVEESKGMPAALDYMKKWVCFEIKQGTPPATGATPFAVKVPDRRTGETGRTLEKLFRDPINCAMGESRLPSLMGLWINGVAYGALDFQEARAPIKIRELFTADGEDKAGRREMYDHLKVICNFDWEGVGIPKADADAVKKSFDRFADTTVNDRFCCGVDQGLCCCMVSVAAISAIGGTAYLAIENGYLDSWLGEHEAVEFPGANRYDKSLLAELEAEARGDRGGCCCFLVWALFIFVLALVGMACYHHAQERNSAGPAPTDSESSDGESSDFGSSTNTNHVNDL